MSKMTDALEEWIVQFNAGRVWFNKISNESTTKLTYLPNLKKYCDWVRKNPDELIEMKVEGLKAVNSSIEFQAETMLESFLISPKHKPTVKDSIRTTVLSFYKNNRRPLVEVMDISTPESKQRCPKTSDIVELENAFFNYRDKAILWFIASAPFRLETIPKLLWKDLKPTGDKEVPFCLLIESERLKGHGRGKYKGVKQVGFLHSLAVKKLEAYKKELERKGYYPTEDDSIFLSYRKEKKVSPFMFYSIEGQFGDASLRAWHDLEKKRFSPHDFRSFVQSALENAGVNPNMIAIILGHKPKGIDFHYSEHDISELLLKFKTALPYLLPESVSNTETNEKVSELENKIRSLNNQVTDMQTKFILEKLTLDRLLRHVQNRNVNITREDLDKELEQGPINSPEEEK